MQDKRKDDTGRFVRAIAAFSSAPETGTERGRRLALSADNQVHTILTEINETVLRRTLVFCNPASETLALDVTERRVLYIRQSNDPAASTLCDKSLTDEDTFAFINLLVRFCGTHRDLFVKAYFPDPLSASEFGGLSVRALFELENNEVAPDTLPPALAHAIDGSKGMVFGLVASLQDGSTIEWGEAQTVKALAQLLEQADALSPEMSDVMLWYGDLDQNRAVLRIRALGCLIFIQCSMDEMSQCFKLWNTFVSDKRGVP